jgi:CheY-like chemotaxis protein
MHPTTNEPARIPCESRRILITDDEKPVRDIFRIILKTKFPSCSFDMACNGQEAIESFRQFHHGILLMDVKMPIMDGPTAFEQICTMCETLNWEKPAVIFCTGFSPAADTAQLCPPDSNFCVVRKPISSEVLIATIRARLPPA